MNQLIGLFCAAMVCAAASVGFWEQASQADFEKGNLKKLALRSDGRLGLAPELKELHDAMAAYLWAVVEDSKGNVYVGGSGQDSKAKLTRIDPSGKAAVITELTGLEIHSLVVDRKDRVYAATAAQATLHLPKLWRGFHPLPDSHDFLLTRCRMDFDREVPVEVGGDVVGLRSSVEYRLAEQVVPVVDWARADPSFSLDRC